MSLDVRHAMTKAIQAQKLSKLSEARYYYDKVLKSFPDHPEACYNKALLELKLGNAHDALDLLKKSIIHKPKSPKFLRTYIVLLIQLSYFTEAKLIIKNTKKMGVFIKDIDLIESSLAQAKAEFVSKKDSHTRDPKLHEYKPILDLFNRDEFKQVLLEANRLLVEYPKSVLLYAVCGASQLALKDYDSSIKFYSKAIEINPNYAEAYNNLGKAHLQKGCLQDAVICFEQAVAKNNAYLEALYNLGYAQRILCDLDSAIKNLSLAIKFDPNNSKAYFELGVAHKQAGNLSEAICSFKKFLTYEPNSAEAYFNLGECHMDSGGFNIAINNFEAVLRISPNQAITHFQLGNCYGFLHKLPEAIYHLKYAIELKPKYVSALTNLGVALKDHGDLDAAIEIFNEILKITPENPDVLFKQSLVFLAKGNFVKGWHQYEKRWEVNAENRSEYIRNHEMMLMKPRWHPGANGKTLLWSEQGIGDVLMFSSIIPEFFDASDELIIQTDNRLIPIFKRSFPKNIKYLSSDLNLNDFDFQVPIGSLPFHFRPSLGSFARSSGPTLKPNMKRRDHFRNYLLGDSDQKIIGVCWLGGTKFDNYYKQRELELSHIAKIFSEQNVILVSLQHGDHQKELDDLEQLHGVKVKTVPNIDYFNDLDGMASLIAACDHVITSDNSLVFLAGGLGVETSVFLPKSPSWRWLQKSQKSYWHSTVNLYWNTAGSKKTHVFQKIKDKILKNMFATSKN